MAIGYVFNNERESTRFDRDFLLDTRRKRERERDSLYKFRAQDNPR